MSEFQILSFNHTGLTVSRLDDVIPLFRDLFGFELISRAPRSPELISGVTGIPGAKVEIAYLRGAGHTIELLEYAAPADRQVVVSRSCDPGDAHIALNVQGIEAAVAASAAYGCEILGEIMTVDAGPNQGAKAVYLQGPDGITVEYIQAA